MYKKKFGENFSDIMKERNWDDEKAADMFGVSPTMIYRYRRGENFPEVEAFLKMGDILNVSADWLGGRTDVREMARSASKAPKDAPAPSFVPPVIRSK